MKRIFSLLTVALAAAALFGGLVYAVLRMTNLSQPAATTLEGATAQRLWATTACAVALAGTVAGAMALARPRSCFGTTTGRRAALGAGIIASSSGVVVLAVADGGPGSGNGVVGGAAALVLGVFAIALGGVAAARARPAGQLQANSHDTIRS